MLPALNLYYWTN